MMREPVEIPVVAAAPGEGTQVQEAEILAEPAAAVDPAAVRIRTRARPRPSARTRRTRVLSVRAKTKCVVKGRSRREPSHHHSPSRKVTVRSSSAMVLVLRRVSTMTRTFQKQGTSALLANAMMVFLRQPTQALAQAAARLLSAMAQVTVLGAQKLRNATRLQKETTIASGAYAVKQAFADSTPRLPAWKLVTSKSATAK